MCESNGADAFLKQRNTGALAIRLDLPDHQGGRASYDVHALPNGGLLPEATKHTIRTRPKRLTWPCCRNNVWRELLECLQPQNQKESENDK